ncbi:unnamed protein product [Pleuronectes platessa]|uniref:WH2 domain-containing protein n=1 Tax=Pleuronectes platessa TaxID=8262 RepID=A0A9N7V444_PLEPL|nr:unnamed protein product [Pleuronectes platessa]
MSAAVNGNRNAEERRGGGEIPYSPTFTGGVDVDTLPVMSWSGQATTNPPTVPLPNQLSQQHLQSETGEEPREEGKGNMLVAIRKGVKLKRALTNDRSSPRIA